MTTPLLAITSAVPRPSLALVLKLLHDPLALVVSSDSGVEPVFYSYYHPETRGLNFEGMIADMDVRFNHHVDLFSKLIRVRCISVRRCQPSVLSADH